MDIKKSTSISYSEVGMLSKITRDYLDGNESVVPFYNVASNAKNIWNVIQAKKDFPVENRATLVKVLNEQYGDLTSPSVRNNIDALSDGNTYTVTTGHQLNLFTGPLYFIYKIVSAIQTAKQLGIDYPELNFVPVYWMATEDHDFDEINHSYIDGKKIPWESNQTGMVGAFSLNGIQDTVDAFCKALGDTITAKEMTTLIRNAYLKPGNLADATRFLVHELFKDKGLVILDGNHRELKQLFAPVVSRELEEQVSFKTVSKTIVEFGSKYSAQVSPREINLFYVKDGIRERIVKLDKGYSVNNTPITFDKREIALEIERFPERFSPNVILRPVYQEVILPNLVYIGGGAEVAYWLELKSTFEALDVPFPLVQIRSSFLMFSSKTIQRIQELNWRIQDVYLKKSELVTTYTDSINPMERDIREFKEKVFMDLETLGLNLNTFDSELDKSLRASKRGLEKSIIRLSKKVSGAVKRKNADHIQKMDAVLNAVNPNGVYQERQVSFFEMYAKYGPKLMTFIFENTEPFCKDFKVLVL